MTRACINIYGCNCTMYARWQRDPDIFEFEVVSLQKPSHKKPESPCKFHATLHDFELLSLLRHNMTPAQ